MRKLGIDPKDTEPHSVFGNMDLVYKSLVQQNIICKSKVKTDDGDVCIYTWGIVTFV